jgi:uncharacterized Fe-S center protein
MAKVFFHKTDAGTSKEEISQIAKMLLEHILTEANIKLNDKVPLKVHFGESGNTTYIPSSCYEGIIKSLSERNVSTSFMETSVMYGGQRHNRSLHEKTAAEHGFVQVPVEIADGEQGEDFSEIAVSGGKHFKTCKIGKDFEQYSQLIVLSHFKGHMLAGFGGALKQLSMGFASKGGKLAMHMGIKPHLVNRKCKTCGLCQSRCNENAITIGTKSFIDPEKCVGCGACVSICPHKAISIFSIKGIFNAIFQRNRFREKLMEYAFAAHHGRQNIYMNFALNITKGCDCEPRKMKPLMEDLGIFISLDPVAIDRACYDMVKNSGHAFKGAEQFVYAEKLGLGSCNYQLIDMTS